MRCFLAALFLLTVAAGEPPASGSEPDAAVAEAARWVEPRGCASGSFRSRALPVVTEIEEAWHLDFEKVEAPPVHWDGTGYVVARAGGKPTLFAFDLATGKERARVVLRGFLPSSPVLVWDHLVLVQPDDQQITGYRLEGKKLEVAWTFRGNGAHPRTPVVHDNEIYCFLGDDLARIRPGASAATWTVPARPGSGRPAVCGPYLFLAAFDTPFQGKTAAGQAGLFADLWLTVCRRSNGAEVASRKVGAGKAENGRGGKVDVMVAGSSVYIGSEWPLLTTDGTASTCIQPADIGADGVSFHVEPWFWDCQVPPAYHPRLGTLLLSPSKKGTGLQWCEDREGKFYTIAEESDQPDFFRDRVSPTVLGDIVYFGSWACDLETDEILWRLPVKQVTFSPVPADGLVLVVDDARSIRAFRGRGKT